jgi:hypothetical protein
MVNKYIRIFRGLDGSVVVAAKTKEALILLEEFIENHKSKDI